MKDSENSRKPIKIFVIVVFFHDLNTTTTMYNLKTLNSLNNRNNDRAM